MSSLLEHLQREPGAQVFVHCQQSVRCPAEPPVARAGVERCAADRALVLARSHDIVCVADEVDPDYLAYLAELGLGPAPENVVPASRFEEPPSGGTLSARLEHNSDALRALGTMVRRSGPTRIHPFIASRGPLSLAAALEVAAELEVRVAAGDPELVAYADQKHHIRRKAIELGIPVAGGEVVELPVAGGRRRRDYDVVRAAVARQLGRTGRVIVRGVRGVGGSATFVVGGEGEDVDGLIRRLPEHTENRVYLVEVMVPIVVSPNVQLHIEPAGGAITCVGVTDQRWERVLVHGGNLYPTAARTVDRMLDWSHRLAKWLQREGFSGLLGLDFVEYADPETGEPRAFLAEVNPRVNRAAYPLGIFERLNLVRRNAGLPPLGAFVSGTIATRHRRFAELRQAAEGFLYTLSRGSGMVPCSIGDLADGKCGVVLLGGSREEVLRAYGELQTWCRRERESPVAEVRRPE